LAGTRKGLFTKEDLLFAYVSTKQHLVSRCGLAVCTALGTKESDVAGVVLAAAIGATRNVDANATNFGEPFFFKCFANGFCEAS
jgi:hypothetical protein